MIAKVEVRKNWLPQFQWDQWIVFVPAANELGFTVDKFEHFWAALAHALYITKKKESNI